MTAAMLSQVCLRRDEARSSRESYIIDTSLVVRDDSFCISYGNIHFYLTLEFKLDSLPGCFESRLIVNSNSSNAIHYVTET